MQNLTTISPAVSKFTHLIKMDTDTRQMETGDYFSRTVGVMKRRENIKVAIRPIDSVIIGKYFLSLRSGSKNEH